MLVALVCVRFVCVCLPSSPLPHPPRVIFVCVKYILCVVVGVVRSCFCVAFRLVCAVSRECVVGGKWWCSLHTTTPISIPLQHAPHTCFCHNHYLLHNLLLKIWGIWHLASRRYQIQLNLAPCLFLNICLSPFSFAFYSKWNQFLAYKGNWNIILIPKNSCMKRGDERHNRCWASMIHSSCHLFCFLFFY